MASNDRVINDIYKKIERERSLIQGAKAMSQNTTNKDVKRRCESNIHESLKNIEYLEKALHNLQLKRSSVIATSENGVSNAAIKDDSVAPVAGSDSLPLPKAPFMREGQVTSPSKARPNYTELDLIKYDSPHLGPRIQLMLQQLEFKLSVEHQIREGIDKLVRLYQIEGDRRNRSSAENQKIENNQKIHLLKQALKRYQDMHIDIDDDDITDNRSLDSPNIRRPLTGRLKISVLAIEDVDHAGGIRNRAPETVFTLKIDDQSKARSRPSRTDKFTETFDIPVDKGNEIEVAVYDKSGDHDVPIGIMWMRISDIVEELRRKKLELDLTHSGWVSADKTQDNGSQTTLANSSTSFASNSSPSVNISGNSNSPRQATGGASQPSPTGDQDLYVDDWFVLEPTGKIHIRVAFMKHNRSSRPIEMGRLGRQGAIRQRKEEVHEMYGHKFTQQQFYNVMRCAFCGEFLKYSSGYQCEECKYTCHRKCYPKVVTKCISKSSTDVDPDEEKINHRIPHRFEPMINLTANWCCHCGYMLPLGKKNARKCTECGLTCHADCVHLVPDFCGMSMETASKIIEALRNKKPTARSDGTGRQVQSTGAPVTPVYDTRVPDDYASQYGPRTPSSTSSNSSSTLATSPYATAAAATAMQNRANVTESFYYEQDVSRISPRQDGRNRAQLSVQQSQDQKYQQLLQKQQDQLLQEQRLRKQLQQQQQQKLQQQQQQQQQQLLQQRQQQQQPEATALSTDSVRPLVPRKGVPPKRKIGLDDFNFLAVLGKGNFGKVMLAEAKSSKNLYAIKVLKKEYILENDEVENTRSEKRVFLLATRERHPFLLNLHSCFQTETRVYFVMEYISGGDLMWHIQKEQFSAKRAQFYAAEVLLGLKYFHECGVIYRDLKLDNILLTLDGHIKIADYGLCKENMWFGSTTGTFCGTPELMAPEILQEQKYGREVDWWAFGVLIYQMILGQSPFRGEDEHEIFGAILADEPLYPIHMARNSVSILQQLLIRDPKRRLGGGPDDALEVMAHPYFENINWDDIYEKRLTPPYVPTIDSPTDTRNFDQEFTREVPVLTPVSTVLTKADQEQFRGFSYLHADPL
ncbi:hypothetical protein V1511DRAFT_508698 [Dipodascopsis uninucleata]